MRRSALVPSLVVFVFFIACSRMEISSEDPDTRALRREIRARILRLEDTAVPLTEGERLVAMGNVSKLYRLREFLPAWSDGKSSSEQVDKLIEAIRESSKEGLRPADYHLAELEQLVKEVRDLEKQQGRRAALSKLANLDVLLTDAFVAYGSHLFSGRLNPNSLNEDWLIKRHKINIAGLLQNAIKEGKVRETLAGLTPQKPGYELLRQALADHREALEKGPWPVIPSGAFLRPTFRDRRVALLRSRLAASGEGSGSSSRGATFFDEELKKSLQAFQRRHGLKASGVLDTKTLEALNIPLEDRISQIEVNLERWRWMPRKLREPYIFVDIAAFKLDVYERESPISSMRIMVGKDQRETPVFSDEITHLVISPSWRVPRKIAVEDLLPKIQKDPQYLVKGKFQVFPEGKAEGEALDPQAIDWASLSEEKFPYTLKQAPGPHNSLGSVKFMFPNPFSVYLHGTPHTELFAKEVRTFSSGCIRIEKPLELAELLLRGGEKTWSQGEIQELIDRGEEKTLLLPKPVDVHLFYWTAWVDEKKIVNFRSDIYGWDSSVNLALHQQVAPVRAAD